MRGALWLPSLLFGQTGLGEFSIPEDTASDNHSQGPLKAQGIRCHGFNRKTAKNMENPNTLPKVQSS